MDADTTSPSTKRQFKDITNENLLKILEEKDKASTKKATEGALRHLKEFLHAKQLPSIDALDETNLPEILYDFYPAVKPNNCEDYAVQTLKCLRSALARHFRVSKGFDITKDSAFIKANEMFKAVTVQSKKKGKGVRQSTLAITQIDLERISEYFNHDQVTKPDPKKLQKHLLFYIIYYFCRRGRENLYTMTKDTFKLMVEPDGTEYLVQHIDEVDKNHGPDDYNATNEGRMYGNSGKKH